MRETEEILAGIERLRRERHAVILAHNYQLGEVQDIADFVGDSLDLSRKAQATDAGVIVFCGVHFMAETAAILSPDKIVLLPELSAGCPMADMIDAETLIGLRAKHPEATVVCYVNTTAEVKAESDICCTSANAARVVSQVPAGQPILFVPDRNLGAYVERSTGRTMTLWPGYCPVHDRIRASHILERKALLPDATVIVHPECRAEVIDLADEVASTSGMVRYAKETQASRIIVATELGLVHRLRKEAPDKAFVPATEQAVCPHMKLVSLEKILLSLESLEPRVSVPSDVRDRAAAAVERMVAVVA